MTEAAPRPKRVLVHVGAPKTGTSFVQDVLWLNRELLAEQGILYPADRFDEHFLAALDLLELQWGGLENQAVGAWDRLATRVREWDGTVVVSHEILATASRPQVRRALESFGDAEVHVVLSARDLVRQIPAEWQENVKHRRTLGYGDFLDRITDPERAGELASWFWGVQEVPDILDRWAASIPRDRVHLVTVPPPGAPPGLLWERYSRAFGLDDVDGLELDLAVERANPSLGVPETALVRRINRAANRVLDPPDYRPLVRELLAHQTLSRRTSSPRLQLPPRLYPWAAELARSWVEEIQTRGYDVVGDVSDLLGAPPDGAYADPDAPRERAVAGAAVDAIKALLLENARLREGEERLARELHETRESLNRAYLRPSYLRRERLVRGLESTSAGRVAMRLYRRARGRSSRSA